MIIANGFLEVLLSEGEGLNEKGFPIVTELEWDVPIECQIVPVSLNRLGDANGEHVTNNSYSILIEKPLEFSAERVRLSRLDGQTIGIFSVRSIEVLDAVGELKIIV